MPGSSLSSPSPTLRHQRCQRTQWAASLPSWGYCGAVGESVSQGGPRGWARLLQGASEGSASQHPASQPFPSLTAIRYQRDIPMCQRNPKPLPTPSHSPWSPLSHPSAWPCQHAWGRAPTSHQSPQLPSALARVPSWRYSYQQLWHVGDGGLPSSGWCETIPYSTSIYRGRSAGGVKGQASLQSRDFSFPLKKKKP